MTARAATPLSPIHCPACGAPVPLATEGAARCAHCATVVTLPPEYVAAVQALAATVTARRAAEPRLRRLAWGSGTPTRVVTATLLCGAPPLAALLGEGFLGLDTSVAFAGLVLPSLIPGVALWAFTATARELGSEFTAGLAAAPPPAPGRPPGCRSCGAPLALTPAAGSPALSATCGYCGTDSLLTSVPLRAVRSQRYAATAALTEAIRGLARRRVLLALGTLGGSGVVALVSLALLLGLLLTA